MTNPRPTHKKSKQQLSNQRYYAKNRVRFLAMRKANREAQKAAGVPPPPRVCGAYKGQVRSREEVALILGVTPQRVGQIEEAALRKLRVGFGLLRAVKVKGLGRKSLTLYNPVTDCPEVESMRETLREMTS